MKRGPVTKLAHLQQELARAMTACEVGDDATALKWLRRAVRTYRFAKYNAINGYTDRGRKPGSRQKTDPDAAAIEWGLAEAKRTGCRDPYALAGETPTDVLKEIRRCRSRKSPDKEPEAWESTVKRIGGKLKTALEQLSLPD